MQNLNRLDAIKQMYDAPIGETLILESGEQICSWILLDKNGDIADITGLDDEQIAAAYEENQNWMEPA
jgi:hypothetical protein